MICRWSSFVNSTNIHWEFHLRPTPFRDSMQTPHLHRIHKRREGGRQIKIKWNKIKNVPWRKLKEVTKWQGKRSHPTAGGQLSSKRSIWPKPERYKRASHGASGQWERPWERKRSAGWLAGQCGQGILRWRKKPKTGPKSRQWEG